MPQLHAHTTRYSSSSNTESGGKKHLAGPVFADIALASDADGDCISEADLIAYNAGGGGPSWESLDPQYTADGCVNEDEFDAIMIEMQGLGMRHARAVG